MKSKEIDLLEFIDCYNPCYTENAIITLIVSRLIDGRLWSSNVNRKHYPAVFLTDKTNDFFKTNTPLFYSGEPKI